MSGIIDLVGLRTWWDEQSAETRRMLREAYSVEREVKKLESSEILSTSDTATRTLEIMAKWVSTITLSESLFETAENYAQNTIEKHFLFMTAWTRYKRVGEMGLLEKYLIKDCSTFEKFREEYLKEYSTMPNFPSFKELSLLFERRSDYEKSIAVAERALDLGVRDSTSFERRIVRLKRKTVTK